MKSVIELAKEAGFDIEPNVLLGEGAYVDGIAITKKLERFAALVRADERMKALEVARTIGGYCAVEFEQEYLE